MALVVVMLAVTASGADDVGAAARVLTREGEGRKAQWAPTRNFSRLNTRAVLSGESRVGASPYAGEGGKTAAGGFVFAWDVDGRLVSATTPQVGNNPGIQAEYEYDGLGLRRQATVTETPLAPAPPITTVRTWTWGGADGEEEVAEDSNLTTHVAGFRVGDGLNAFTHDGLGSVVTQTAGGTTTTAQFSSWGTRTALGPPLASSSGYTGHRVELTLGLTYAQQRWLDTKTGTFLSRDPIGAASYLMRPNELYAFGYAAGNPTRYIDPTGRGSECGSEGGSAGPGGTPESCVAPELSPEAKVLVTGMVCAVPALTGACVVGAGASGWEQSAAMVDAQVNGRPVPETDFGAMADGASSCAVAGPVLGKLPAPVKKALVVGGAVSATYGAAQDAADGNYCSAGVKMVGALGSTAATFGPPKIPNMSLNISPPPGGMPAMAVVGGGTRGGAIARPAVAAAAGGPSGNNPLAVAMAAAGGSSTDDIDRWENEGGALEPTKPPTSVTPSVAETWSGRAVVGRSPQPIRYTQDSIAGTFKNGRTLQQTISDLRAGKLSPDQIPPIRVFQKNGQLFTLDNRRLYVFKAANVKIRTVEATAQEIAAEKFKFTSRNNGVSIRVR